MSDHLLVVNTSSYILLSCEHEDICVYYNMLQAWAIKYMYTEHKLIRPLIGRAM